MSKLSQRISRVARYESGPLGFGAIANRKSEQTMLLVVRLAANDARRIADLAKVGVDIALIDSPGTQKLPDAGELIAGGVITSGDSTIAASLREAGFDFLVLEPESVQADVLQDEQLGFVFAMSPAAEDSELRLLESLTLDALLLPAVKAPLTVKQQLELRRVALLAHKPLLVTLPDVIAGPQLRSLRDSGVIGVVVDGKADKTIAGVRKAIDEMPPRRQRREERTTALLPSMGFRSAPEEHDDEDD